MASIISYYQNNKTVSFLVDYEVSTLPASKVYNSITSKKHCDKDDTTAV
jgi:hypothetical protein